LPDGNGDSNTVDPDPTRPNSNFDLLFVPREYDFGKLTISDDLTKPIFNKTDEGLNGHAENVGVGDVRGTKAGWHVTAKSTGMKLGDESVEGSIATSAINLYPLVYNTATKTYDYQDANLADPATKPEIVNKTTFSITLGGDATLLANATAGKGQGLWQFTMFNTSLNITTPANNIKAGAYTGNITWNLVAGPSI